MQRTRTQTTFADHAHSGNLQRTRPRLAPDVTLLQRPACLRWTLGGHDRVWRRLEDGVCPTLARFPVSSFVFLLIPSLPVVLCLSFSIRSLRVDFLPGSFKAVAGPGSQVR